MAEEKPSPESEMVSLLTRAQTIGRIADGTDKMIKAASFVSFDDDELKKLKVLMDKAAEPVEQRTSTNAAVKEKGERALNEIKFDILRMVLPKVGVNVEELEDDIKKERVERGSSDNQNLRILNSLMDLQFEKYNVKTPPQPIVNSPALELAAIAASGGKGSDAAKKAVAAKLTTLPVKDDYSGVAESVRSQLRGMARALDVNNDGTLTPEELKKLPGLNEAALKQAGGGLSTEEFAAGIEKATASLELRKADSNKDLKLSKEEYTGALNQVAKDLAALPLPVRKAEAAAKAK